MTEGLWRRDLIGWIVLAALLPVAAMLVVDQGGPGALRALAAFAAAAFWQVVFRAWQGVPLSPSGAVLAVSVGILAPEGLTALQIALGASFGIVLAELVFGGWGRNVICAPCAALAMLYLSHPGAPPPPAETSMTLAAAASALVLLASGIASAAVIGAALAGAALVTAALGLPVAGLLPAGAFAFGLVFLLADPVAAPTTAAARLAYGALAGGLAALLAGETGLPGAGQAVVFAILLAQIFAPALDHAGIGLLRLARERRHA